MDQIYYAILSRLQNSPFKSGAELSKVKRYIESALMRQHSEADVTAALLGRGWSQKQVNYAFKRAKKPEKEELPEEKFLQKKFPIFVSDLSNEEKTIFEVLKKRKNIGLKMNKNL